MIRGLIRMMRPKQWTKNVFVFAALVFDHKLLDPQYLALSLAGFVIFCLLSSSVYLINDLADIEKDRLHPKKRNRPLASGQLSPTVAVIAAIVLIGVCLPLGLYLDFGFGAVAALYLVINLLYSFGIKAVVLLDVLVLASGFLLRAVAGALLIESEISPWLYICISLLALFIGFGKRRGELLLMNSGHESRRVLQEYSLPFLDGLINLVATATIIGYSFYTFSAPNLPANYSMMLTIPFVLYGIFRYLYLIHIKGEGGAPDELVLVDRPLQVAVGLWALFAVIILYLNRPG
jgi:4-hydroxybenzoate polyprenyltransferase